MTTLTDLFCGAGGSSTGAEMVPGIEVVMAANHWALAIETHQANHPNTAHDCADLSQVDPRRYPTTDILWASPSCTNHSIAKGISRQRQDEARRRDLAGHLADLTDTITHTPDQPSPSDAELTRAEDQLLARADLNRTHLWTSISKPLDTHTSYAI